MIVGFFDLETSSLDAEYGQLLCGVHGRFDPDNPVEPRLSVHRLADFDHKRWDDLQLALILKEELEKYDLLISYNGVRFDVPFLNTRLIEQGYGGVTIKRHKDLLYTMRTKFRLGSNRLERVLTFLFGESRKTRLDPVRWRKAITGDRDSYEFIVDHCERDVRELARVWDRVKGVAGELK